MVTVRDEVLATMPPLRGVVHAAGVVDDGMLVHQTWERWQAVLHGKAHGAWVLDAITARPAARLLRAVLDGRDPARARRPRRLRGRQRRAGRHRVGTPGPRAACPERRLGAVGRGRHGGAPARAGWRSLERARAGVDHAARGLRALERLLRDDATHVAVLPIDWRRFVAQLPAGADLDFFRDVAPSGRSTRPDGFDPAAPTAASVVDGWRAALPADRRRLVLAHLADRARHVLGTRTGSTRASP